MIGDSVVPRPLKGFFTYSRRDDNNSGRQLSTIREFLSNEVGGLRGSPFELFQDVEDGVKGPPWEPDLWSALGQADVLIPVISPSFFTSKWCREEFSTFISERENRNQNTLVFPLYFITANEMEEDKQTSAIAAAIHRFHLNDIREYRVLPMQGSVYDIEPKLARILQTICEAINNQHLGSRDEPLAPVSNRSKRPLYFQAAVSSNESDPRDLLGLIRELMVEHGYREQDLIATSTVFRELYENAVRYAGTNNVDINIELDHIAKQHPHHHEGLTIQVGDTGRGFNLEDKIRKLDRELAQEGREHGLLRAFRLGTFLSNEFDPHRVYWLRELAPQIGLTAFSTETVVPVVFSWTHEAIRINDLVVTFAQWEQFRPVSRGGQTTRQARSDSFMDLVLDPLLRPGQNTIAIEIIGQGWSWALSPHSVFVEIQSFVARSNSHLQNVVLYADTDASEQRGIRAFAQEAGWALFETLDQARAWCSKREVSLR